MKITKEMIPLISDIEYEIGKECYNGNSFNGWTQTFGCGFRYPITYDIDEEHAEKTKLSIQNEPKITTKNLHTVCYKFGSNELLIAHGIENVLNMLEKRYGLDFEELEKEYRKK